MDVVILGRPHRVLDLGSKYTDSAVGGYAKRKRKENKV